MADRVKAAPGRCRLWVKLVFLVEIVSQMKRQILAGGLVRYVQDGLDYRKFIAKFALRSNCQSYFEIGVNRGRSLAGVDAAAVGVDPNMRLAFDVVGKKPMALLYQMTSDDFFAKHDLTGLFGRAVDMAFLDGMHTFEFLLRDFINTERHCHEGSTIFLHDCFPVNAEMTERERNAEARRDKELRNYWTGDVWKLIPILKTYRPELSITCTNCAPTGLAIIRGLSPGSRVLADNVDRIVAEYMPQDITEENIAAYYEANQFVTPDVVLEAL